MGQAVGTIGILDARSPSGRSQRSFSSGVSVSPSAHLVSELVRRSATKGSLRFVDARTLGLKPEDLASGSGSATDLLSTVPADAWGGIRLLGCASEPRSQNVTRGSGTSMVQVTEYWYEATCSAELAVVDAGGTALATLSVEGRNESGRRDQPDSVSVQEQAFWASIDDAARRMIDQAARRKLRLPVPFDRQAPLAAEGLAEIDAGRLPAARALWEGALAANPASAGLRFNLGAVCEALGDPAAARSAYEDCLKLAPGHADARKAVARLATAPAPAPAK